MTWIRPSASLARAVPKKSDHSDVTADRAPRLSHVPGEIQGIRFVMECGPGDKEAVSGLNGRREIVLASLASCQRAHWRGSDSRDVTAEKLKPDRAHKGQRA